MRISDWSSDVCSSDLCGKLRGWRDVRNVDAKYVDGNGAMQITVPGHPYLPMVQAYATIALRPAYRFHGVQSAIKGGPLRPHGFCVSERERKRGPRSEEHTSELQSLMRISYAVFCLKKKNTNN